MKVLEIALIRLQNKGDSLTQDQKDVLHMALRMYRILNQYVSVGLKYFDVAYSKLHLILDHFE